MGSDANDVAEHLSRLFVVMSTQELYGQDEEDELVVALFIVESEEERLPVLRCA